MDMEYNSSRIGGELGKLLQSMSLHGHTPGKSGNHVGVFKSSTEGVSYPATPQWNIERPFLTGQMHMDFKVTGQRTGSKSSSTDTFKNGDVNRAIGIFAPSVQELLVIDDLLFTMVGIEGMYIWIKRGRGKDSGIMFQVDASMDLALQELAKRILPLCENYILIYAFVESRSYFKHGLVNHALAAALRTILHDYHAMVAQLEHQFRLGRLSLQGLWFFCQPMMGAMQALTIVVQKASAHNLSGSAILNLLQSQLNMQVFYSMQLVIRSMTLKAIKMKEMQEHKDRIFESPRLILSEPRSKLHLPRAKVDRRFILPAFS